MHTSEVVDAFRAGPSAKGFGVSARLDGERRRRGRQRRSKKNHVLDVQLQTRIRIATLDYWTARVGDADDVDEALPLESVAEDVDAVDSFGLAFSVQLGIVSERFGQVLQGKQTAAGRVSEIRTEMKRKEERKEETIRERRRLGRTCRRPSHRPHSQTASVQSFQETSERLCGPLRACTLAPGAWRATDDWRSRLRGLFGAGSSAGVKQRARTRGGR